MERFLLSTLIQFKREDLAHFNAFVEAIRKGIEKGKKYQFYNLDEDKKPTVLVAEVHNNLELDSFILNHFARYKGGDQKGKKKKKQKTSYRRSKV